MSRDISAGLRHVSASRSTLSLIMEDGTAVYLKDGELGRLLDEVAMHAPELLHLAMERRMVQMIVREVRE